MVLTLVLRARHRGRWVGSSCHDRSVGRYCLMALLGSQQLNWARCHGAFRFWVLVVDRGPKRAAWGLMLVLRAQRRGRWVGCFYRRRGVHGRCLMAQLGSQRLHWRCLMSLWGSQRLHGTQGREVLLLWVRAAGHGPGCVPLGQMLVGAQRRGRLVGRSCRHRGVNGLCLLLLWGSQLLHGSPGDTALVSWVLTADRRGGDGRCRGYLSV